MGFSEYNTRVLNGLIQQSAMELARDYGIGMVGMRNLTTSMRGGAYVLYRLSPRFCRTTTNSIAVMPVWVVKITVLVQTL